MPIYGLEAPPPNLNVAPPDVLGNMAKMASLKEMLGQNAMIPGALQAQGLENQQRQQTIQSTQQQIQKQTYDLARQKAIDTAFQSAYTPDENGQPQLDEGKLVKGISQAGYGSAAPEIAGSLVKWHQAQTELQKTHQEVAAKGVDMLGNLAYAAHQAGDDPHILISGLKQLAQTDPSVAPIAQQLMANPEKAPELIQHLMGQSPEVQKLLTSRQEAEARSSTAKTSAERLQAELPGGALQPPDKAEMQDWLGKNPGKGPADYEKWKASLAPQAQINVQGGLLNNQARDMAAENYFQTGQLPSGMRSPAMSAAIMSRAAELHPNGTTELAGNRASYEANKKSYDNVTGTLDTLSAFEQSGLKNLKQFTDLADKLPDTGVPWLNTPIRNLNKNLVGAQYMPAIEAARSVALREIARVTNDPKLSGALTDSARGEVSAFSPENATLPQIKNVVKVLQADMANVHTSLAAQKADIGTRLGIKAPKTQEGGGSSGALQVGQTVSIKGKPLKVTAVHPDGSFDVK
jgi:hypothetical protein